MYKSWYTKNRKWGITYNIFPKAIKDTCSYNKWERCYRNGIHFSHYNDGWFIFLVLGCRRIILYTPIGVIPQKCPYKSNGGLSMTKEQKHQIDVRASKALANTDWREDNECNAYIDGYEQCIIDQRKIDLDNMCKYIERFNNDMPMTMQMTMQIDVESFRKWAERAMEG